MHVYAIYPNDVRDAREGEDSVDVAGRDVLNPAPLFGGGEKLGDLPYGRRRDRWVIAWPRKLTTSEWRSLFSNWSQVEKDGHSVYAGTEETLRSHPAAPLFLLAQYRDADGKKGWARESDVPSGTDVLRKGIVPHRFL